MRSKLDFRILKFKDIVEILNLPFYLKTSIALNRRNIFQLTAEQYENWSQHHTLPSLLLSFVICIVSKVVDIHQMLRCFVIYPRRIRNNLQFARCCSCHWVSGALELRNGVQDNAVERTWSADYSYGRLYCISTASLQQSQPQQSVILMRFYEIVHFCCIVLLQPSSLVRHQFLASVIIFRITNVIVATLFEVLLFNQRLN